MAQRPIIPIAKPLIGDEEKAAVAAVLDSGIIAQGTVVQEFEKRFAAYCGVPHAVAVSSGTAALYLSLLAHDVGPGDEVITTPFSFFATASTILMTGAKPVFADISPDTFNLDPRSVEPLITDKTRALMPVHLYGQMSDMKELSRLAEAFELVIVEDAAQAHGAAQDGVLAGTIGTGSFSFYPTKNMTAVEGGMITTGDEAVAERARQLRNHGMVAQYVHEFLGGNYRMTDVHAAVGLAQLDKLDGFNLARRRNAAALSDRLAGVLPAPVEQHGFHHVFHQYTVQVPDRRDALVQELIDQGVGVGIYYPGLLPDQAAVQAHCGERSTLHPVADNVCKSVLSLPVHPGVSERDIDRISAAVRKAVT